jgi:hypothetical protein
MREFNMKFCWDISYCTANINLLVCVRDQLQVVLFLPSTKIGDWN